MMVSNSVVSLSTALFSSSLKRTTVSRRTPPTTKSSSSSSSLRRVKAFKIANATTLTILYLTVTGGFVPTTTSGFAMAMGGDDGTTIQTTTTVVRTENASSVFNGKYSDPNHPGCLRGIERVRSTTKAKVFGEDGTPGCQADGQKETKKWELEGELRGENEILIDFSKKGGPKNLLGKWTGSGVLFPDGNTWSKL
jgi:hypothetical protein